MAAEEATTRGVEGARQLDQVDGGPSTGTFSATLNPVLGSTVGVQLTNCTFDTHY